MYEQMDNSRILVPWHIVRYSVIAATKFLFKSEKFCGIGMVQWDTAFKS